MRQAKQLYCLPTILKGKDFWEQLKVEINKDKQLFIFFFK
jgi:hypothetical protein